MRPKPYLVRDGGNVAVVNADWPGLPGALLSLIRDQPGITSPEIVAAMGRAHRASDIAAALSSTRGRNHAVELARGDRWRSYQAGWYPGRAGPGAQHVRDSHTRAAWQQHTDPATARTLLDEFTVRLLTSHPAVARNLAASKHLMHDLVFSRHGLPDSAAQAVTWDVCHNTRDALRALDDLAASAGQGDGSGTCDTVPGN